MRFNLRNTVFAIAAINLAGIAPSLAISLTDVHADDLNSIDFQEITVQADLGVVETYGETQLTPSQGGSAVVALKNGNVQWFDKILTLTADDLTQFSTSSILFMVDNNSPYDWSGYHFEFYDPSFTQKIALTGLAMWDPTSGFETGEAVLGGVIQATNTDGAVPSDFSSLLIDGFNFYGSPGVASGDSWLSILAFDHQAAIDAGICTADVDCKIGIRQIATVANVPEPSSLLGLLTLGILGAGVALKGKQ